MNIFHVNGGVPLFFFLLFCLSSDLGAQSRGVIEGTVRDSAGAGIPGVTVVVTGTSRGAISNAEGRVKITGILPDSYQLEVSSPGYYRKTIEVFVEANDTTRFVATLTEEPTEVEIIPGRPPDIGPTGRIREISREELLGSSALPDPQTHGSRTIITREQLLRH